MQTFSSGREAKEYLVAKIVAEAERGGTPLTATERKMMYFSETAWTLPDIVEVNEVFERDYDAASYEAKISGVAKRARAHADQAKELATWKEAVRILQREDHYLLVLLTAAQNESSALVTMDRLKLVGTALLLCLLFLAGIVLFSATK